MSRVQLMSCMAALLVSLCCQAEERTIAGTAVPVSVVRNETTHQCEVLVNRISSLEFDCEEAYLPRVLANYSGALGKLLQVLIIQELPGGNACNGGPLHILAITQEKKPLDAEPIDFCGGKDPVVSRKGQAVLITLPGGAPNRGEGFISTERWSYQEGVLRRIK